MWKIGPEIYRIRSRIANHSIATFGGNKFVTQGKRKTDSCHVEVSEISLGMY
jgi:hypothetical protein